jgi:hypothetical protein
MLLLVGHDAVSDSRSRLTACPVDAAIRHLPSIAKEAVNERIAWPIVVADTRTKSSVRITIEAKKRLVAGVADDGNLRKMIRHVETPRKFQGAGRGCFNIPSHSILHTSNRQTKLSSSGSVELQRVA